MLFTATLGLSLAHNLITDLYTFHSLLGSVYSALFYYHFCMPFRASLGLYKANNFNEIVLFICGHVSLIRLLQMG